MSTITMIVIITTMSLASATRQYSLALAGHACDEDAARALKRPWAPVVFHGERETESLPEIDARFTSRCVKRRVALVRSRRPRRLDALAERGRHHDCFRDSRNR